jgi:hypothetical protein
MNLASLRRKYGSVFITTLENGVVIPWKQLDIGEFIEYSALLEGQSYARATIEDEIFQKCVLDEFIVDDLPVLKAGTVTTVVRDIIENSGPVSIDSLNYALNGFRIVATQAIHQTMILISQAFPAYKPEDIYKLKYADFMLRLAQAEQKLMDLGILQNRINFEDPEKQKQEAPKENKKGAMDLYMEYLEEQGLEKPTERKSAPVPPRRNETDTIITQSDIRASATDMVGHEKEDEGISIDQMTKDANIIYADYMKQMEEGKELDIKTPEDRLAEAQKREEANKAKVAGQHSRQKQAGIAMEEHYADVFKRSRSKKRK